MKYLKLFILACCLIAGLSGLLRAQTGNPSTSGKFVLKNDAGNTITLAVPSSSVTNYGLTLPALNGGTGGMLYLTNGTGSFGWLAAGTNNQVLTISGGIPTWATLSAGTVSSVGLVMPSIFTVTNSPITSSGNLTATLNSQSAGLVFAGPATGPAASPTFRALTSTDIPSLNYVSSVGLAMPSIFTVSNSPVTSSGTLTASLNTQIANVFFAGPSSGVPTAPAFRLITTTDIPNLSGSYIVNGTTLQTANFNISGNGTIDGQLQLKGTSTGITTFQAGAQGAVNINYTLPITAPTVGQILSSNASGVLNWINASAGTVTSVGLTMPAVLYSSVTNSPITSSGTLIPQLATQTANFVFAGPTTGAATTPTFRSLVANDIPNLSSSYIVNGTTLQTANFNISGNGGIGGQLQFEGVGTGITTFQLGAQGATNINYTLPITAPTSGQILSSSNTGALSWINASTGTVTSVGLAMPSIFTVSNSPVTTAGTLTASLNTQAANLFFAGPSSGAAVVPTFRAITATDVPALPYLSSVGLTMPAVLYSSVTNSPLTSNGTLIPQLATQTANFVFAGPTTGAATTPTFRALVANDIPSGSTNYIQNTAALQPSSNYHISGNGEVEGQLQLKGTGTGITTFQAGAQGATNINYTLPITAPTNGQVLSSLSTGVMSWVSAATGTVTSVGLAMPSIFTVTNSPVTTTGTLTASLNTQNANLFFAGPSSGVPAIPTFRAIAPSDLNGSGWSITGNSGTVAGTNFIGTTDNIDFVTKVNNAERARIRSADGFMTLGGNFTPLAPLHIKNANSGHATLYLQNTAADGYSSVDFLNDAGTTVNVGTSNSTAAAFPNQFYFNVSAGTTIPITFNQQTVEKMRIDVNGNVYVANNLGVGTTSMNTKVDIDGGLSIRPSTPATISASGQITVGNRSYIRITHDGTAATYTMTLTNGSQDGQLLIIQCNGIDGTHPFKFADGGTLALSGDFVPNTNRSTISLIWDGSEWVETGRSLN